MATSKKTEELASPLGEIQFMAISSPVVNEQKEMDEYVLRIALDSKKHADWIAKIAAINPNIPVTADTYRGSNEAIKAVLNQGKTLIKAASKFPPTVFDKDGNELDEAPNYFADSKGTAKMVVTPFKGKKGGSINLVAVEIHTLEGGTKTSGGTREERLARLRASLQDEAK